MTTRRVPTRTQPARKVTIVIPFRNQLAYLMKTLESVAATQTKAFDAQVILIDNASEENLDTGLIDALDLPYTLIRNRRNRAVSQPWNLGLRLGFNEHAAEAVCLLNSDVILGEGWIEHCVRALDGGAYCSFPFCYTEGGEVTPDFHKRARQASLGRFHRAYNNVLLRRQHAPGEDYYADPHFDLTCDPVDMHESDGFNGYCFWLSRQCVEDLGYIDEKMAICYSDTDYRNRLVVSGHAPVCVHSCLSHHFLSRTLRTMMKTYRGKRRLALDKAHFHTKWHSEFDRAWRIHCIGELARGRHAAA
jgi:GT2 family glycosyltransferase